MRDSLIFEYTSTHDFLTFHALCLSMTCGIINSPALHRDVYLKKTQSLIFMHN